MAIADRSQDLPDKVSCFNFLNTPVIFEVEVLFEFSAFCILSKDPDLQTVSDDVKDPRIIK